MKTNHFLTLAGALLMLVSCGENVEKSAQRYLDAAQACCDAGNFAEAKNQIDSIKVLYPKAFEARKAGIALMRQVELKEAQQTLAYADSLAEENNARLEALLPKFIFEKDAQYQEIGNYLSPSQKIENNLGRNYVRATVDEKGHMNLTSVYRGAAYIHHRSLRVSAGGTFAQTPESGHLYESSDAMGKTERNDFALGADSGVVAFIAHHAGEPMKVDFIGDKTFSTTLTKQDTRAIADVYALALALQAAENINAMQDEATRKISFIQAKESKAGESEEK